MDSSSVVDGIVRSHHKFILFRPKESLTPPNKNPVAQLTGF
jgi:hypothetical protein